jgi:tetratricopeptide (TPR) repeat protein
MQATRLEPAYVAALFELGKLYFDRKQWQEASLWLSRVPPGSARAREAVFFYGVACFRMEDYEAAERAFAHVAAQVPVDEVFNNLAATQIQLGRPEALATLNRVLEGTNDDPDYRFNSGFAFYRLAQLPKAAEEFRAVLDRVPDDQEAADLLSRCLKPSTVRSPAVPRLKTAYPEAAFRQLQAVIAGKK